MSPRLLFVIAIVIAIGVASAGQAQPFEVETWKVRGRPLEAHAVAADGENWLVVVSVEGAPPAERRFVTVGVVGKAHRTRVELADVVVAIDLEDLDPARGPEILTIERDKLRVLGIDGSELLVVPVSPRLPLPPRTRQLSRLQVLGDWDGLGRREALLPDLEGFRLVPLAAPDEAHGLRMSLSHASEGIGGGLSLRGFWVSQIGWPNLALADADGDGRSELFASDRFGLSLFQRGAAGLAKEASSLQSFPPFSFEEELRYRSNFLRAEPADFDGDGRSDLLVVRTAGTVLSSRTHAALYRNRGSAPDPTAAPDAELSVEGGFGQVQPVDLDGDGVAELLQMEVAFGIVQMIRVFTSGRGDVRLRLHTVHARGEGLALSETWSETISVPFDTKTSRVGTLLPRADGDWNGDGLLDLIYGDRRGLVIRLAERGPNGLRFSEVESVAIAPSEGGLAADLDGDGFDDLVLFDPIDPEGRLRILRNRGVLPGSPARIGARD